MAGQSKKESKEAEQTFNRQINFLVMRKMWQTIRGRAKKGEGDSQTIYQTFGMSRERYTRAINGVPIRLSQKELRRLVEKTGVSADTFRGETCFQFEAISRTDWEKLFELRDTGRKQAGEYERNLYKQMRQSDVDSVKNPDLYRFAVYLKSREPVTDIRFELEVQDKTEWLMGNGVYQLERCGTDVLSNYLSALERQTDIVKTLVHYRELRDKK